ncbi:MFS transporter [Streptomyces sp. NPDC058459]|uniref:MFS transporter n=1 Tax=Streptomyces sp. NPDC058459 TaxID=3346508 RepID=UPI00364DD631
MTTTARTAAPRGPLALPLFRSLWLAQLASGIGGWMQTVAAQWMLVSRPGAATWVSLVQAASLLPMLFVSLPAGVLADVLDRRRLLIAVQVSMAVGAGALAALTAAGLTTPALLIAVTFVLGCGQALGNPAWQAIQPELVPREQIPAAAALGSMGVNVARAIGPALAGVLLTVTSTWVLFTLNAVSYLAVVGALLAWRRAEPADAEPETAARALRAGARYVRHAPGVRRILARAALFVLPASALWALLPVVASDRLHQGSGGYGLLLAALGLGAVLGAALMGRARRILTPSRLVAAASALFALGTLGAALMHSLVVVTVLMVPTGLGWLLALSALNTTMQLSLPAWVRARGLAVYLVVFMGGQGIGSLLWGLLARPLTTTGALVLAAALLLLTALTMPLLPLLPQSGTLDRTPVAAWPEPALSFLPDHDSGPVLVQVEYRVGDSEAPGFLAAARHLGTSRRRTGATRWGMFRDTASPDRYLEVFELPSWDEHLRQHHSRTTGYDQELLDAVRAYATAEPQVRHLMTARPEGNPP